MENENKKNESTIKSLKLNLNTIKIVALEPKDAPVLCGQPPQKGLLGIVADY